MDHARFVAFAGGRAYPLSSAAVGERASLAVPAAGLRRSSGEPARLASNVARECPPISAERWAAWIDRRTSAVLVFTTLPPGSRRAARDIPRYSRRRQDGGRLLPETMGSQIRPSGSPELKGHARAPRVNAGGTTQPGIWKRNRARSTGARSAAHRGNRPNPVIERSAAKGGPKASEPSLPPTRRSSREQWRRTKTAPL